MASEQQHNAQAMFNLAYMHEQGLGMKKDIHLAKRFYDLAADTNADAKIPVALALIKLQLIYKFESLREDNLVKMLMGLDENIASNWDLYLITVMTIFLGMIIYSRRPAPETMQTESNGSNGNQNEADVPNVGPTETRHENPDDGVQ